MLSVDLPGVVILPDEMPSGAGANLSECWILGISLVD